jgi:hypothetical protein
MVVKAAVDDDVEVRVDGDNLWFRSNGGSLRAAGASSCSLARVASSDD